MEEWASLAYAVGPENRSAPLTADTVGSNPTSSSILGVSDYRKVQADCKPVIPRDLVGSTPTAPTSAGMRELE
jgi:hypothetical protein